MLWDALSSALHDHAAGAAHERCLTDAVLPVGVPALGALPAGVRRIDIHQRHPGTLRLVFHEGGELVEAPRVQLCPLVLAEPYPVTNPTQVFECDAASGSFSGSDNALGDEVVDACSVSLLPSARRSAPQASGCDSSLP
jgi:hypothetical protein